MNRFLEIVLILFCITSKTAAQQNWAAVPCFDLKAGDAIGRIIKNDAQNELILCSYYSYQICNHTYKAFFAYNGNTFHDMDLGIEAQNPNLWLGYSAKLNDCVEWNGKAIIIGGFSTVGSDTLYSKSVAVWNGTVWDTFPHPLWNNKPNFNVGFSELLKDNDKIWMFAGYDSTGNNPKFRPVLYDGSTFTMIPAIPVSVSSAIIKAIKYRNKLIVTGNFYDYPSYNFNKLAQFDGTNWSQMGIGVRGTLTGVGELAVYNDTLYIAGNFSKADGNTGNYIMKWDGSQLTDAGFGGWCGYGPIRRLLPFRNRLYAFGGFNCAANQKAFGVAYYENGKWVVPQDSIPNGVDDAVLYNDAIYIGGDFESINGDSTLRKFTKLLCPDFDAKAGCISGLKEVSDKLDVKVFPNPSRDKLILEFEQSTAVDKISILNTLGQEMYNLMKPVSGQEINISFLSGGIYYFKVQSKYQQTVLKVVKE
jgi:hypothetical protein